MVWPEHVLPARFGLPQKFRQRGRALEIFAHESPPDVIWPVAAQAKNGKISPTFPPNLPQIHQKIPIYQKKFDENGADLGGAACWGVPGGAPAMPQQGAPPIYA